MTTMRYPALVLAIAAVLAIGTVGCSNKAKTKATPETAPASTGTPQPQPAETAPPPVAEPFPPQPVDKAPVVEPSIAELNRQRVLRTVYFAYNSNEVDDAARTTLQENAAWLAAHTQYNVEIGGYCDERGSIGYNVALGDRRATAVKDYLVSLGADGSKLVAISYGEENPVDPGHDDAAWAKNRRAEFTIKP